MALLSMFRLARYSLLTTALVVAGHSIGFCAAASSQAAPSATTAKTPQVQNAPQAPKATTPARKRLIRKSRTAKATVVPVVQQLRPEPPPAPNWPANSQAQRATVGWNGRDLSIAASNSSLLQILRDVSTATGVKVEGMGSDLRVFGSYGPAGARDVLGQLLEGSGYNVLMVGEQGTGTPRQVVLTTKAHGASGAPAQPGGANQSNQGSDDDVQEEPEQPEAPPQQPSFRQPPQPQGSARTPQQIMDELQQRQTQQQQQQQAVPEQPQQ